MLKTIFHVINNLLNQSLNESFCLKICILQGVVESWTRFFFHSVRNQEDEGLAHIAKLDAL